MTTLALATEVQRLRLDVLAVDLSRSLAAAGVPHALLKGPTTATWLYPEGRPYRDVDLLVPASRLSDAVRALAGAARPVARAFEESPHSQVLVSVEGFEVDLHVAPPGTSATGDDRWWDVLAPTLEPWEMDVGTVPALGPAGRCLVLALHALNSGPTDTQAATDLRRALTRADAPWAAAAALADAAGVRDSFDAGVSGRARTGRAALHLAAAPPAAFALQRFADASWPGRVALLRQEALPSRGFLARADPRSTAGPVALAHAHARRWVRLGRQLPGAVQVLRTTRR